MSLADVVNRIAQGTQAGKQAVASGASNAEARQAARQAAGVQVPSGRQSFAPKTANIMQNVLQAAQNEARKNVQTIAPGLIQNEPSLSDEEETAYSKKDQETKRTKHENEERNPILDFFIPQAYAYEGNEDIEMAPLADIIQQGTQNAMSKLESDLSKDKKVDSSLSDESILNPKTTSTVNSDFFTNIANDYINAAFNPSNRDMTVSTLRDSNGIRSLDNGYNTNPAQYQYLYNQGLLTPRELVNIANTGSDIKLSNNQSLQESANSGTLQATIEKLIKDKKATRRPEKEFGVGEKDAQSPTVEGPKGGKNRSQMQEYYDWIESGMLDPSDARYNAEAAAFIDRYGDLADRDLGYSRLRASGNSDAWGYLLGLQGNQGVGNWRNRYALSGVDFSDEATALNNLMDYLYGDGSINILDYMTNPYSTVQLANDADAIGQMARWLFSEYNYSPETAWMAENGLDANDIAMQAIARQVTNNGWGGIDVDQINDLLAASGDRSKFALVDEDSDEFKNSAWRQQNVVNNGNIKKYGSLMSDVYNPYKDYGLIDEDLSAAMMAAYNADPRHSKRLALV